MNMERKEMKCKKCGNEFEGKFCTECGTPAFAENTTPQIAEQPEKDRKGKHKRKSGNKKPIYKRWWFYAVIAVAVIVVALSASGKDRGEKIDWSKIEMHDMLPVPESKVGEIYSNSEDRISVSFYKTSENEYKNYVSQCKDLGFTVDSDSSSNDYRAYNSDGYKLNIQWYDKKMSIELEAPMKFTEIQWPSGSLGKMLPKPKSNQGKFSSEYDDSFFLYVANTSPQDYAEYVKKCSDAGFNVDYSKSDNYYNAKNKQGYTVSLKYEGYNIMSISVDSPKKVDSEDKKGEMTTNKANYTDEKSTSEVNKKGNQIDIINKANCSDFAKILETQNEFDPAIKSFAQKYEGKEIEFDGYVASVANYEGYNTRFNYLIYVGEYGKANISGPQFQFKNVNYYDLHLTGDNIPNSLKEGTNIHVIAEVKSYDENSGLFEIRPISVSVR